MRLSRIASSSAMIIVLSVSHAFAEPTRTCSAFKFSDIFRRPVEKILKLVRKNPDSKILELTEPLIISGTFGPEFTFTNETLVNEGNKALNKALDAGKHPSEALKTEFNMAKYQNFKEILEEKCRIRKDCTTSIGYDKHGENIRVTYQDGWYFEVGIDMCVIETQTKPGRIADFIYNKNRLEEDLWQVAESLDLRPHYRAGQGHVHIGLSAFNNDPILLRNFFVDYSNRPELAFGALGNHLGNSPPIAALKPEQREGLQTALKQFDALETKTIPDFVRLITRNVYTASTIEGWDGADYYHAIRLERSMRINSASTIEIRAFRPQQTVDQFILQLELLQSRINFLRAKPLIQYHETDKYQYSRQDIVNSFYQYVTETGLSWEKYKVLLPPEMQSIAVTDKPIDR